MRPSQGIVHPVNSSYARKITKPPPDANGPAAGGKNIVVGWTISAYAVGAIWILGDKILNPVTTREARYVQCHR